VYIFFFLWCWTLSPNFKSFLLGVGWDWVHLVRRPLTGLLYQPRMIDDECGAVGGMRIGKGNRSTRRKLTTLSTANPTWPEMGSNPGRRGGKPAINRLSYGTANYTSYLSFFHFCNRPTNDSESTWLKGAGHKFS
jgi:hypothetical protein